MSAIERLTEIGEQEQEGLTKYKAVIGSDHAYIHKGLAFTAIISTGSISAAYRIAFKTPASAAGKYIHWRPIGITSSADYVSIKLTEGDTYTGGSDVTPINRNRTSSTVSVMQAFKTGVTSTPAGTVIQATGIGTAGNPTAISGGGAAADQELLLKPDTVYVFTLTPAGATSCELELFWYEEDGYHA